MELLTEKHAEGFCLVYPGTLLTVTEGEPHRRATLYFSTRKAAEEHRDKIHKAAEILARAGYLADTQEYIIRAMLAGAASHTKQAAAYWLNKAEDSQAAAELVEAIHAAHPGGSIWDREELEAEALRVVSAANYYDLADNIDATSDEELHQIIKAAGSEKLEEAIAS